MEPNRKSTLRSKRKPLSDCTNILPTHRKNSSLSSSSKPLKSQTLIPSSKTSNFNNINNNNNKLNNSNNNNNSSPKSHTSTGSNNVADYISVPRSPDPPAPITPLSDAGGIGCKKSRISANQSERHDAATRKDKGKMVADTPIIQSHDATSWKDMGKMVSDSPLIQLAASLTAKPLEISSSTAPGHCSRPDIHPFQSQRYDATTRNDLKSGLSDNHNQRHDTVTRKDKGKMVADTHISQLHDATRKDKGLMVVDTPVSQLDDATRRKDKGKIIADTPVSQLDDATRRKDKGKMIADTPVSQLDDATRRKDKGKMIADTPIIQFSAFLTAKPLVISSSTDPGHGSHSDIQAVQSQNLHTPTVKDKEKTTTDASWVSKYLHESPSVSSGSLSVTPVVHSHKLHEDTRKDRGKMVLETPDFGASEPSTPHAPLSSLAASGTRERPLTVYNQRRTRQGNKHAAGKSNLLFSCPPPHQKIKKTGVELSYGRVDNKSGSHTDPIPVHKKKRSRNDGPMHVMPQEEVEKLRAYYADLDSFELPEEVASESDKE